MSRGERPWNEHITNLRGQAKAYHYHVSPGLTCVYLEAHRGIAWKNYSPRVLHGQAFLTTCNNAHEIVTSLAMLSEITPSMPPPSPISSSLSSSANATAAISLTLAALVARLCALASARRALRVCSRGRISLRAGSACWTALSQPRLRFISSKISSTAQSVSGNRALFTPGAYSWSGSRTQRAPSAAARESEACFLTERSTRPPTTYTCTRRAITLLAIVAITVPQNYCAIRMGCVAARLLCVCISRVLFF